MTKKIWKLPQIKRIKKQLFLDKKWKQKVKESRQTLADIISWKSNKKILLIGPCSIDFEESLFKYADFLKDIKEKYSDKLEIVMRFYTWKPRTTIWWKWLLYSKPWEITNIRQQIKTVRSIAIKLIQKYNISLADELLYPELSARLWDLYSYMAIWARSNENALHREISSSFNFPIWLKNPTSWDIRIMVNSVKASNSPQEYVLDRVIYKTPWNNLAHSILRWWSSWANYDKKYIKEIEKLYKKNNIQNSSIIVDCNHDNSQKNHLKQIEIMKEVMSYNNPIIKWFMVESYLYNWNQKYSMNCKKWLSLTDPCIWLQDTKKFIEELYKKL